MSVIYKNECPPVITIDGPGGVGKGTLCHLLAQQLGWNILDSGSLYRLTALAALRRNIPLDDEARLSRIGENLDVSFVTDSDKGMRIFLEGEDVTDAIRSESCGDAASQIASLPGIRQALLQRQRDFCQAPGLVADGRDMGTVVFPDAEVKIFLTASVEERAVRRYGQLREKGIDVSLAALKKEIAARDERDSKRQFAPLKPAEDAAILDTTGLSIEKVKESALAIIRKRLFQRSENLISGGLGNCS